MNNWKVFFNGLVKENPTFVLLLGMCPTLATTTSAVNGMCMVGGIERKKEQARGESMKKRSKLKIS